MQGSDFSQTMISYAFVILQMNNIISFHDWNDAVKQPNHKSVNIFKLFYRKRERGVW